MRVDPVYPAQLVWHEWITLRRSRLDMTKHALYQVMDFLGHDTTRQTIWRVETGRVTPTAKTRAMFEEALDACEAGCSARSKVTL